MTFGELTNILLFEKENYGTIHQCVSKLHDFYASITGITAEHTTDTNVFLPTGRAISPGQAANCLLDIRRTVVFLRGIRKAILRLQHTIPAPHQREPYPDNSRPYNSEISEQKHGAGLQQPIHILYAGCGPYATLLTPLTTVFSPQQVRFHLLDVNQQSITAAEMLYKQLGATNYVEEFICADASTYQINHPIDIVICEAMQSALAREPQVAITQNLVPQLPPHAIFIPERITISAVIVDPDEEMQSYLVDAPQPQRTFLGDVFTIGREHLPLLEPSEIKPPTTSTSAPAEITIPANTPPGNELQLFTTIDVFDDEKLTVNNCGITLPLKVMPVAETAGKRVRFQYQVSERPGFQWELLA